MAEMALLSRFECLCQKAFILLTKVPLLSRWRIPNVADWALARLLTGDAARAGRRGGLGKTRASSAPVFSFLTLQGMRLVYGMGYMLSRGLESKALHVFQN